MKVTFDRTVRQKNWDEAVLEFCKLHGCFVSYADKVLPVVVGLVAQSIANGNSLHFRGLGTLEAVLEYNLRHNAITQHTSWEWIPEKIYASSPTEDQKVQDALGLKRVKAVSFGRTKSPGTRSREYYLPSIQGGKKRLIKHGNSQCSRPGDIQENSDATDRDSDT
jgi:hypothetical protein